MRQIGDIMISRKSIASWVLMALVIGASLRSRVRDK
jgi:hypothetical protein